MLSKLFNQFQCSTMMLPEHVEAISEHHQEKKKTEALYVPEVDQQQLEEWEWLLRNSFDSKSPIRVSYIAHDRRNTITGIVELINTNKKAITLKTKNGGKTISSNTIIGVIEG